MLGRFEHFPATIHGSRIFITTMTAKRMQETVLRTLLIVNSATFKLEEITHPTIPQVTVVFEFGIADRDCFNYLNQQNVNEALRTIRKTALSTLDFLCDIRYYREDGEKKKALRFDYYMLRFVFEDKRVAAQISHEKGPRHLAPEDVIQFVALKINENVSKRALREAEE